MVHIREHTRNHTPWTLGTAVHDIGATTSYVRSTVTEFPWPAEIRRMLKAVIPSRPFLWSLAAAARTPSLSSQNLCSSEHMMRKGYRVQFPWILADCSAVVAAAHRSGRRWRLPMSGACLLRLFPLNVITPCTGSRLPSPSSPRQQSQHWTRSTVDRHVVNRK